MQLVQISDDHYVIVDETVPIEEGKVFLTADNLIHTVYGYNYRDRVVTHSTKFLEPIVDSMESTVKHIELEEIKQCISSEGSHSKTSWDCTLESGKLKLI